MMSSQTQAEAVAKHRLSRQAEILSDFINRAESQEIARCHDILSEMFTNALDRARNRHPEAFEAAHAQFKQHRSENEFCFESREWAPIDWGS